MKPTLRYILLDIDDVPKSIFTREMFYSKTGRLDAGKLIVISVTKTHFKNWNTK